MNHEVFNNYIEGTDDFGIQVYEGDLYDESNGTTFTHAQVVNAKITHNTIVNSLGPAIQLGAGGNVLPPKDSIIANNLLVGSGTLFTEDNSNPAINMTYAQNLVWSRNPNKTGFVLTNPLLTTVDGLQKLSAASPAINAANPSYSFNLAEDMDAQTRDALRDVGADEFGSGDVLLRPLSAADVGPLSAVLVADLNMDGQLDAADWAIFRAGQGTELAGLTAIQAYFRGDLTGDRSHDLADFVVFRTAFDEAHGAGAFSRMLFGVPEPNAGVFAALAVVGLVGVRWQSRGALQRYR
jgi:hypothetical protein